MKIAAFGCIFVLLITDPPPLQMNEHTVIVAACRSPIGEFNKDFAALSAADIGAVVIREALKKSQLLNETESISEVIMGQVYSAGCGQNPARQSAVSAGIPVSVPAWTLNMLCGSGLKAIALADQAIRLGEGRIVVAGGQESMTRAPHLLQMRCPKKFGDTTAQDSLLLDGLRDAFGNGHMGNTAENVASKWHISRAAQDDFALRSQRLCLAAQQQLKFSEELVPVPVAASAVTKDACPRQDTSTESLGRLRPAFQPTGGTVTAGNASKLADGAAACVLMAASEAKARGLAPLGRIAGFAQSGCEPAVMGVGPVEAVRRALERCGWALADVEAIELNEAFAAQSVAVAQELGLAQDDPRLNRSGGAIALGHPIGASGARCLVTLLHRLRQENATRGLVALCVGGGMGVAMCVERPSAS